MSKIYAVFLPQTTGFDVKYQGKLFYDLHYVRGQTRAPIWSPWIFRSMRVQSICEHYYLHRKPKGGGMTLASKIVDESAVQLLNTDVTFKGEEKGFMW